MSAAKKFMYYRLLSTSYIFNTVCVYTLSVKRRSLYTMVHSSVCVCVCLFVREIYLREKHFILFRQRSDATTVADVSM